MNSKNIILVSISIAIGICITSIYNWTANQIYGTQMIQIANQDHIYTNITEKFKKVLQNNNCSDYSKFTEIRDALERYYYTGIDHTGMLEGALHGRVDGLGDPHTVYMEAVQNSGYMQDLQGSQNFEGIGAVISKKAYRFVVQEVLAGSPADQNDLRIGDIITSINGSDLSKDMSSIEIVAKIRGPKGSIVRLDIYRPSDSTYKTLNIKRDTISISSVNHKVLSGNIGYISISIIGEDTAEAFGQSIHYLNSQNTKGLIIDLRSNGGGILPQAVDVLSYFVPGGTMLFYSQYKNFPEEKYYSKGYTGINKVPMVVLIDENTASASETIAGVLKILYKATIVGSQSFGKGSIQTISDFSDGSSIKYSIGKRYLPDGANVEGTGIIPDIEIDFDYKKFDQNGYDTQLQEALKKLHK